tara:strand:+ start:1831 stop:2970 length:1140 start_codon:yes stop_codon:yes gene_type:complete
MSKGGNSLIPETETRTSRVLFISSGDATAIFNDNRSNYKFTLEEAVVVPNHHSIVMSLIGAEIPYSFYNFVSGRNTLLYYQYNAVPGATNYVAGVVNPVTILVLRPNGNWNAVELADYITRGINVQQGLAVNTFQMLYDPIALKFKFIMNALGRVTLAMKNSPNLVEDMNEEIGFDLTNTPGDPFVEYVLSPTPIRYGYVNEPIGGTGVGLNTYLDGGGMPVVVPPNALDFLYADDVCDMSNSIRTLFIRSNLTSSSVLDSHVGGGFSNILARIPIDREPGEIINIRASDGNVHQLLLKVKDFTEIHIRLTNQRNEEINLNGLDFNISLKLDFIENKRLQMPDNIRQLVDEGKKEIKDIEKVDKDLSKTKKKKTKKPVN